MQFKNSKRLDNVVALFKHLFPQVKFETQSVGLRLAEEEPISSSILRVTSKHWEYVIETTIDFDKDKKIQDTSVYLENRAELEDFILTQPLASRVCFAKETDYIYKANLIDVMLKLYHDLRYGNMLEEMESNEHPYLLPLVNSQKDKDLSRVFATTSTEHGTYLFDEKITFDYFKSYLESELYWLLESTKEFVDSEYPEEWDFHMRVVNDSVVKDHFLTIFKYLSPLTAQRFKGMTTEEEFEGILLLVTDKPQVVTKLGYTFTKDVIILSVPNKVFEDGMVEEDPDNMVSSFIINRKGFLPKNYALESYHNIISNMFSYILQVLVQESDLEGTTDLEGYFFP